MRIAERHPIYAVIETEAGQDPVKNPRLKMVQVDHPELLRIMAAARCEVKS